MSAAGSTPQQQLMTLGTNPSAVAAVANAAAAAQSAGGLNFSSSGQGSVGLGLPVNFSTLTPAALQQLSAGFVGNQQMEMLLRRQVQTQQQQQQQQQGQSSKGTSNVGPPTKKQKGATGLSVAQGLSNTSNIAQLANAHLQQMQQQNAFTNSYGMLTNYMGNATATPHMPESMIPRGRWTEEMTFRLIALRSEMEPRFKTIARPDKLWNEITQAISQEFITVLPKQSTKDKWKNLRSSFRLINQGKHPSHYTKETWPFYGQIERFLEQRAEAEKQQDLMHGPRMTMGELDSRNVRGGSDDHKMDSGESDGEDGGDDDDDDGGGNDHDDGGEDKTNETGRPKRGKKRDREESNASGSTGGGMNLDAGKEPSRRERELAANMRSVTSQLSSSIQDSHQALLQLTRTFNDIADKLAPVQAQKRAQKEQQMRHDMRMQEVSVEVDVVRAELKHLPLLVQLFDQYRQFYSQPSDPERAAQFLMERITKNQSVIFIALPRQSVDVIDSQLPDTGIGSSSSSSLDQNVVDPAENLLANNMTSSLSVQDGISNTTVGNAARSHQGRLPAFAYGFAQLYPSYSSIRLSRHWILNDLFVHSSVRNRGIASLLLTHGKKFASDSGATSMELSTAANNITAQKLYQRLEWKKETEYVVYNQKL